MYIYNPTHLVIMFPIVMMEDGYDDLIVKVPRELRDKDATVTSYHYLQHNDIVSSLMSGILVTVIPAQCLLRNQISRSLFSSREEV